MLVLQWSVYMLLVYVNKSDPRVLIIIITVVLLVVIIIILALSDM